jgi:hypothetical protein
VTILVAVVLAVVAITVIGSGIRQHRENQGCGYYYRGSEIEEIPPSEYLPGKLPYILPSALDTLGGPLNCMRLSNPIWWTPPDFAQLGG